MADTTQGTGAPQAPQGDDATPKYVTEEQLNKAITARFGEFTKKHSAVLDDRLSSFEKKLIEALPKQPEPGSPQDTSKQSVLEHPEVKGMQAKLRELEERARKAEERTAAEEKRARDLTLRQNVTEALTSANVKDPLRAKHAASFLIREGLAKWNETSDAIVFVDAKDGEMDFATGFKSWLKSDDAKLYLPSPEATPPRQQSAQRVPGAGTTPPQNLDDLSFDDKLAMAGDQLAKLGVGLT